LVTDMPVEFGGSGDQVTPGWLFRAGLASCLATCIAMRAAAAGIVLESLAVTAGTRSDTRGLLGMADAAGDAVCAAPVEVRLDVRISCSQISPQRLRELVEESHRCSPVPTAVRSVVPVALLIEIGQG
jgi:organic hydroperoxide reductase OsmC/OhrA